MRKRVLSLLLAAALIAGLLPNVFAAAPAFADVAEGTYCYEPVLWAVEHEITNGTSATTFGPNRTCTRGQVVTFLWRAKGSPEPVRTDNPFTDVAPSSYYYKAVLWAVENEITNGISATSFKPDQGCTRGQVVTFLHRSQGSPAPASTSCPFTDVAPGYYYNAMLWAVENKITNGTSETTFGPAATCTRGQIVTFLYRAVGNAPADPSDPSDPSRPGTPLTIVSQPEGGALGQNGTLSLSIAVTGGVEPYTYQWHRDNAPIGNTNLRSYVATQPGRYFCTVYDAAGNSVVSSTVVVTESASPTPSRPLAIASQPQSATVQAGDAIHLTVSVSGGIEPYTYQWQSGGVDIPGATSASYDTDTAGYYSCTITDAAGTSITTGIAVVTAQVQPGSPLTILRQPEGGTVEQSGALSLSIAVGGGVEPYTYQWYKDGAPIANANFRSYVTAQSGHYFCAVYDAMGDSVVSSTAIVTAPTVQYSIHYDLYGNDNYLESAGVENPNPDAYTSDAGLQLRNPSAAGYIFEGWYDGPGASAAQVRQIASGETGDKYLYARWSLQQYTVQFQSSLSNVLDTDSKTFTVDKGTVLPRPELSNYVFAGWSDEDGNLYQSIPAGTAKNLTLTANWTSERNKTWTKPVLDDPIIQIDEENDIILFAYEIGMIQNVPLYTIKDFGFIASGGVQRSESTTYSTTVTEQSMESYAKAVAKATTESSSWTLSDEWNESTSIDEQWCQENGKTVEQAESVSKSDTGTWNISSGRNGSAERTSLTTNQDGWENQVKVSASDEHSSSHTDSNTAGVNAKLTYEPKSLSVGIGDLSVGTGGGLGGELGASYEHGWSDTTTDTHQSGIEASGSVNHSELTTNSSTLNAGWNTNASFSSSSTASRTMSSSVALSEKISQSYGYGKSYSSGGSSSNTQGLSSSNSTSDEYASSVTYSTQTAEEVTSSWSTQATKSGYHRWIIAGTAHVFGVVGYDMKTQSYFVYTYSVMDDETHEFEDYSTNPAYNDEENGVIPFEVPHEVADYVAEYTFWSDGLKINQTTGVITGYEGKDTCVVLPEYMNVGNGDVVKVTGIAPTAFRGNTNIRMVVLSDFITEIPDDAFAGCTALTGVTGGNVSSIGARAFAGCAAIDDIGVRSSVTHLGAHAFDGVRRALVNASNAEVAQATLDCGAEQIILCLGTLAQGPDAMSGVTLTAPAGTRYFELNGAGQTYRDLSVVSEADVTSINKTRLACTGKIPLQISSAEVVLNQTSVQASGIGLVLTADRTHLGLQDIITVETASENAILSKNLQLYEINRNVVGELHPAGKVLVCGGVEGVDLLVPPDYEVIDQARFDSLLHSYTLYFDAAGGTCAEDSREVANSAAIGELPVPTRPYYNFTGWFLDDGTEVSAQSAFSDGLDHTVHAGWEQRPISDWVPYDALPADAEVVDEKWTYTQVSKAESYNTSMDGYTQTGSYWVQSGSGSTNYASFPSGFDTGNSIYTSFAKSAYSASETATTKRTVSNAWAGYVYWHWMYDCGGANAYYRAIYDRRGTGPANGFGYRYFGAFTSTSGYTYYGNDYCNNLNRPVYWQTGRNSYADSQGSYFWFRFDYYRSSYTDYRKMFQYQKTEQLESRSPVSAGTSGNVTISDVQHYVQYRAK